MWKRRKKESCYCAFCRSPRSLPPKRSLTASDFLALVVATFFFMRLFWAALNPRALILFICFAMALDMIKRFRWRLSLVCKHCGFDPALYLRQPTLASERVKVRLDQREKNPMTAFSKQPRLNLPVRRVRSGDASLATLEKPKAKRLLSKTI